MRKTRIIATLGPASDSPGMIAHPIDPGVTVSRLTLSNPPHDWVRPAVPATRAPANHPHTSVVS